MNINRFICILVCTMMVNFAIAQNYNIWTVSDHSHSNVITCNHDHGADKILKNLDPEDEFIPQKGERVDDAIGLNVLIVEGKASVDRVETLFPRDREQEFIDGISGYLGDIPNALVNETNYLSRDMPYLNNPFYMNYSASAVEMPSGFDDRDVMNFSDPNEGTGTNPLNEAIRNELIALESQEIFIDIIIIYLPVTPTLNNGSGSAKINCNLNDEYLIISLISNYDTHSNKNLILAGLTNTTSHEVGHTILLNHEKDTNGGLILQASFCDIENYAQVSESNSASFMSSSRNIAGLVAYKNENGSFMSKTNAFKAIETLLRKKWLPERSCTPIDWYADFDNDGFVDINNSVSACSQPEGYILETEIDCDDSNSNINPNADEIDNNEIDENCDGELLKTATDDREIIYGLDLFPNPTRDIISLQINSEHTILNISIFDQIGKKVKSISNINDWKLSIDLEDIESGIYSLVIFVKGDSIAKHVVKI